MHYVGTKCDTPPDDDDVVHSMTWGAVYHYGDAIEFACKPGKWFSRKQFSYTTTCSANGTWEPTIKSCTGNCGKSGDHSVIKQFAVDLDLEYVCNKYISILFQESRVRNDKLSMY